MAPASEAFKGRSGARTFAVWDPLVRLVHWCLALAILLNGAILDGDSPLHEIVGYMAFALVATRVVWGLIGTGPARFAAFPPNPAAALRHLRLMVCGKGPVHLSHNPLGALMAYNIWATVLVLVATGYLMGTLRFFGSKWLEEAHEMAFNWLLVSVALHICGVAFDSWRTRVALVPAMITGRKTVPGDRSVQ
ncbi:cytochrome b/b6 domain-containing protein [Roseibium marinum]|uniref:Cytochrome b n=1 Tax=Roseibium marinum TaxID=281252 RepID=A0A2S3V2Z2_9HYPH|nr:cytochrome b/b6 domain-containing protein [Roseibium marinum]POF34260.1 cytochrome b [Roseibium marinum]